MKRALWFLTIFTVVMSLFYLEPIYFPLTEATQSANPQPTDTLPNDSSNAITPLNYDKLTAAGFSVYINKPVSDLEKVFGKPINTQETGLGYTIGNYEDGIRDLFIEVNIKADLVQSIKVAGKSTDKIAPFDFGMSLSELTDITTLFFHFDFDYKEESFDIELTEEDQNYRPLIAFDNETFAILFFGQDHNELYAVDYLNKETLLRLMPYQINSENTLAYKLSDFSEEKWQEIANQNALRSKMLIAYLREQEGYDSYVSNLELQLAASQLIEALNENQIPLVTESSKKTWQSIIPEKENGPASLLTTDAFLLDNEELEKERVIIAAKPIIDPSFTIFWWYSDPYLHSRFISNENQRLEIAFAKESMIVLLEKEMQETDESETQ
ncbi:hypothetical protein M2139_001209 [Enterococcus sp. PF1-24]|uniref:CAP-associated domain-containing protein n=1 Tax=unclassified Enterococcus TaxID=2608891 RepID=UPI0024748180|nr:MULTISPECIES: CAP-associated domain-containing protein [unclassified Enterococcus]MDH6364224.1 hypothetical protein [Enterococcus sp. PFB1-1]MDH6401325.1 hypothetical protein [Enterococcus sp. PF1-24]